MNSLPVITAPGAFLRHGLRLLAGLVLLGSIAAAHPITSPKNKPPAAEFGVGPRLSERGLYTASLQSAEPLRARRAQKVSILIQDAAGQPVEAATIAIDGGMPEHGHGLPTQPRADQAITAGLYAIEGLRFNMGGWWELSFKIEGPAGPDRVMFHLKI
jgi:hypothetical protein